MSAPATLDDSRYRRGGRILVAAAAISWSLGGLMARSVGTDPWTTVFWRGVFCAAFLLAVTAVREGRRTPRVFAHMGATGVGMAVCFAIGSTCFIMALHRTSVANVLIIQSLSPFMAGLLGWIWMGERVAGRTWLAMGVALAGSAIMVSRYFYSTPVRGSIGGDLLAFAVALTFALATVLLRRRRQVQMLPAAALAAGLTAAIAATAALPASAAGRAHPRFRSAERTSLSMEDSAGFSPILSRRSIDEHPLRSNAMPTSARTRWLGGSTGKLDMPSRYSVPEDGSSAGWKGFAAADRSAGGAMSRRPGPVTTP